MGEVLKSWSTLWQKAKPVYTLLELTRTEVLSQNSEAFLAQFQYRTKRNSKLAQIVTHIHFNAMFSIPQRMIRMNQGIVSEDCFQGNAILFVRQGLVPSARYCSVIE